MHAHNLKGKFTNFYQGPWRFLLRNSNDGPLFRHLTEFGGSHRPKTLLFEFLSMTLMKIGELPL